MFHRLSVGRFTGFGSADLRGTGLPFMEDYVRSYVALRGLPHIPDMRFYGAFIHFRMAAILQGVYKRYEQGIEGTSSEVCPRENDCPPIKWTQSGNRMLCKNEHFEHLPPVHTLTV